MGKPKTEKVSTLTGEQKQLLNQILGGASGAFPTGLDAILQQLDPERARGQFQQAVADPALREFQSQVIPSILQSSANLGAKGGSAIERQLAQAGAGLERGLGEQFAGFQAQQQQAGIGNLLQLLLPSVGQQAFAIQQRPSTTQQLFGGALQLGSAALGAPKFGGQ